MNWLERQSTRRKKRQKLLFFEAWRIAKRAREMSKAEAK